MRHLVTLLLIAIYLAFICFSLLNAVWNPDVLHFIYAGAAVFPLFVLLIRWIAQALQRARAWAQAKALQRAEDKLRPPIISPRRR